MALIDNPKVWIVRLFEMEERDGRGTDCQRFPGGVTPPQLPLGQDERVYGIYKGRYYFTPQSFIMALDPGYERIPWADIRNCSSRHGEGKKTAELTLTDGRIVKVRVGDFATGWSGRISQLFHQMIEKWGAKATLGPEPMSIEAFFAVATDDYCLAPNLQPHPPLNDFRDALETLRGQKGVADVLLRVQEVENGVPTSDAVIVRVNPAAPESVLEDFARRWGADGVVEASLEIIRALPVADGVYAKMIVWD